MTAVPYINNTLCVICDSEVFSEEELMRPFLTVSMERRLVRYLVAVRSAAARVEAEREKRLKTVSASPMMIADDRLSSNCIAQSAIGTEESMLECIARGMGLLLGAKGRSTTFYLYLNPNHPHRHIHRLMQSSNLQFENNCVEGEAGAILLQIRGPDGDFGAALISTVPNSSSSSRRSSINLTESWCGRIPITYSTTEERVKVSYIPLSTGIHELSLILRGGSHVPGSPFSVTVEESLKMPVDDDVNGGGLWKASSCDSGLNKFRPRSGSIDSDPGLEKSWEGSLRQKRRVISRIVDFVSEKMILTEDGKLERMPKIRRMVEKKLREKSEREGGEIPSQVLNRYCSATSPPRSRIRQDESDCKIPDQKVVLVLDSSPLLAEEQNQGPRKKEERSDEKFPKKTLDLFSISDAVDPYFSRKGPIDFRDHCRRILWLCDILLKYTPRQEGLEILNTAGDILGGKRVHPTIMEESEPEDNVSSPSGSNTTLMAQRLQRTRTDSNGLNDLTQWKKARRSLHTWSRSERNDSISGGRLLHKDGSYRGVVVRDLNAEAITGAYAGGDDTKDDTKDDKEVDKEEVEKMKEYLREGRPMPRKPHFSMRRRVVERTPEISGAATESLEQTTVPDAEKQPGMAEISGKDNNKHVTTKNTPISYKESKTEKKGVKSSGNYVNKVTQPSIVKSELAKEAESKLLASQGKNYSTEVASRTCDIEIKVTAEDDVLINKQSAEKSKPEVSSSIPTTSQPQKQEAAEMDSGMKRGNLLDEVKKNDIVTTSEEIPSLEVREEGKTNEEHSGKTSFPPVVSSTTPKILGQNKIGEPSDTISIQTERPRVDSPVEERVEGVVTENVEMGLPSGTLEELKEGGREKAVLEEEVKMEMLDTQEKLTCISNNLSMEAKECDVKMEKNLGGAKKRPISSYTHMISRMLCTDSFPRESLEWFESEERVEGEVEGTIETIADLNKTKEGSKNEAEPWGDEDMGPGFGLEDLDVGPGAVGKEVCARRVTTFEEEIPPDFTNPQPNQDEEENEEWPRSKFTETVKRSGVGVGVGVGVVIAGGIVSKEDNSSSVRKRDDCSNWRRRESGRTERMIEMAKQGSTERHWEAISMGIDAMEDESIASIITGVVGGVKDNKDHVRNLRRWSDSEEAKEDMGRKDGEEKSPREYGEERIAGYSITEIPREWGKGTVEHLQSGRVLKEEASGAFERRGVVKGPDSSREGGIGKKKDSEPKGGSIPIGEWWSLGGGVDSGAWGGKETEVGKLGQRTPEEGVEVKEWEGACGGGSAPAERHKGIGGKEGPPSVSAGRTDDPHRTGERKGERRGTTSREASLKHEKIERAEEAGKKRSGAENSKEKRKRSWEKDDDRWGSDGERKGQKREEGVELEDLKIKGGTQMDGRRKEKGKKPLSTGTEFSSESAESENKYSPAAIKESLRDGGESCGRETKGRAGGGRKSNQVLVKSTKGVVLGSVTEWKSETSFQGAMEMGMEKVDNLLGCLIDIPKDSRMNELGSSPKKVGEDMCGVRMSLEDWGRKDGKENLGPETEVIVGECEEVEEEDDDDGGERGEKCTVFKRDRDVKVDDENWVSESDAPLLIMEETSGKRQYNFTVGDSKQGNLIDPNQERIVANKDATNMNIRWNNEGDREVDNEYSKSTSELHSRGEQSIPANRSTSANQDVEREERPKKKLIEPGKIDKVAERQESADDDDTVEEIPRESCEVLSDFDLREEKSQRNRKNYPDLEELLGSDFSCKTTTYRAQFNLWPSEEAFGEKKIAETLESVFTGKSPMTGVVAGILGNPTHFSQTTTIRSNAPNPQRTFEEGSNEDSEENCEGKEDDIEFVEQDFDDRSDEVPARTSEESDFIGFDLHSHPKAKSGDAFLIFESPGVTTYFPFEMEDPTEQKAGIDLRGDWEEVTLFLDDEDTSDDGGKITEIKDDDGKEYETLTDDSSQKNKAPVLPAGRWSNRLSMSPAMSAISEEEAEEALPDKEQRESSLDTGGEPARWDSYEEDTSESDTNRATEEKVFDSATFRKLVEGLGPKVPEKESEPKKSAPNQLPILPIEVEDGFGESFTRRRSSTPSVVNDVGDAPVPSADCGAAFVVSSELAVTLALGVSITQIIPPEVDHPSPIPQAEEGADAIAMEKTASLPGTVGKKEQAIQTEPFLLETENKHTPSSATKEEQRGWILIDTTEEEKAREERDEGEDGWRVEAVGEVEEAASLTIAEERGMRLRSCYGGAIKKESRSGKAECRRSDGEGSEFDSRMVDPIREGMRASHKSGRDNEANSRAKCDENDAVKGKESFVRGKREQGASDVMNKTVGNGINLRGKDDEEWRDSETSIAFEGRRMESSEDAPCRGKANPEERREYTEGSRGNEEERTVTSSPKYQCHESPESEKGRTKERGDELMVDKILELKFGDRASPSKKAARLSRRESVFDDYKFDLWEKGFELKTPRRTVETQDSTGLEYYLNDVEQLLNLELEATEQEVKYISAKEIMENFTKVIESPEKVSESTSSGEWSNTKGSEVPAADDLIGIASGSRDEKGGASPRSASENNLLDIDLSEGVSRSQSGGSQSQGESNKTIDDLLFGDDIHFDQQSAETEAHKLMEGKESLKKESTTEGKQDERRNESQEKPSQPNRNWEEEHALAKKKREQTKRERSGEHKSPKLSEKHRSKNAGIFKKFDKSEENLNLDEESENDGSKRRLSFPKSSSKEEMETTDVLQPEARSEEREVFERENSASTGRDTYPSLTDSSGDFSFQEKMVKEKITPSRKDTELSGLKKERITVDSQNINATDPSIRSSFRLKHTEISGSDSTGEIKPSPKENFSVGESKRADLDHNITGKSETKDKESAGAEFGKGDKTVKRGTIDKRDGMRESESESRKGRKSSQESKLGSQSSSIDEYRRAVSEAYAFLDVQESLDGKVYEEPVKKKSSRRESVSWNAAVARMDSWDTEWSVISGAETGRMQETTGLDEITSSESSLSSPLSETRKATDPTESTASSTKDTSTEETPDTRPRQKYKKSKDFNPDDEALFQTKMTVSSRKEYWDKRLEDMKSQSESVSSPPCKRPSTKHSDAIKKGRMNFEQSSSATENSDSGKSSGESSPPEKRGTRQISSVQRKREATKTTLTQANDLNRKESDQSICKTTPDSSSDSEVAKATLDDRTAISELSEMSLDENFHQDLPTREQKTVKDSQQKESGSSSDKSTETKRVEKKRSALVENTEKMLLKAYTSDDEKSERKVPSIRVKGIVSRSKIELEKHASSPPEAERKAKSKGESPTAESSEQFSDSTSPSEDGEMTKTPPAQKVASKNGESVSRLSKIFTDNDDSEPSASFRKDVKTGRSAEKVSEDTDSERLISSSSEKGCRAEPTRSTSDRRAPMKVQEERIDSTSGALPKRYVSRPAEVMSEDEGGFVARKRMYWDAIRSMSLDTERREPKDATQSPEKADVKKVRSMWERRASLDAVPLTEERRRIGKKLFSENMSKGRISVAPLREASAERDKSPIKVSQQKTATSDSKPKPRAPVEKGVSEKKPSMHKLTPSTTTPESQQGKPLAQSSVKRVKKVSSDKAKKDVGERPGDITPSKPVSSEKPRVVKKVSRSEIKPTEKDATKSKVIEEKTTVAKAVPSEKKSEKKTIKGDKTVEEKLTITDAAPTGKTAEKEATSKVKKTKPKKSPSPELKESTERKVLKDSSTATTVAKSDSQKVPMKEKKIGKKMTSEPSMGVKLMEKTLQETQPKSSSEPLKSANVLSQQKRESLTSKDPWDSDEERKAMEYALTRQRRSSVEIRVTDDEDVCVMREITVIPVFPCKPQMETYEEEEEEGKEIRSLPIDLEGNRKEEIPISRRRSSLPPRNLSAQVSEVAAGGKQRSESGKSTSKHAISPSEESVPKGTVKKKKSPLPMLEERLDTQANSEGLPKVRKKSSASGAVESKHRTIPAIDREHQRAELGEEGYAEKIPATSARGERGDDGRTAISRRTAKGTAPIQKKKPPPSAASSPDSEVDSTELPRSFLSAPTTALRRHSAAVDSMSPDLPGLTKRRGSGELSSPRKSAESKKRFSRAKQFFENMERGKDSPPSDEVEPETLKSKKKKARGTVTDVESIGKSSLRKSSSRRRSPLRNLDVKDDSESTPDSDKPEGERLQQRRRSRRGSCDLIHSAPGSDVDNPWENPQKALQRRKKGGEPVLRSQMFGGSERQPRVSERFNVMDLFKDVAGAGTGGSGDLSGRATPLGIPHQAAVLAALRSVEDVRSSETRSPYDLYRPVEAVDDCVPSPAASPDVNANEEGGAEVGHRAEDDNDNYESSMTLHSKREYQAEYPHLPITSPRRSRHRSSHMDLIPRNVLLKLDKTQSSSKTTPSRTRSQAELF
ncbi:hypothetical protein J437_LFUL009994 [Ladona fulva]|uniref:Uncharacterized protein n=1 Tax=Ladona fulva TaxID=123851 RepID=A0A8K0P2G5_LADFU|nr:hypothetical protein J437_LFUL009994 [Ladona fulva]